MAGRFSYLRNLSALLAAGIVLQGCFPLMLAGAAGAGGYYLGKEDDGSAYSSSKGAYAPVPSTYSAPPKPYVPPPTYPPAAQVQSAPLYATPPVPHPMAPPAGGYAPPPSIPPVTAAPLAPPPAVYVPPPQPPVAAPVAVPQAQVPRYDSRGLTSRAPSQQYHNEYQQWNDTRLVEVIRERILSNAALRVWALEVSAQQGLVTLDGRVDNREAYTQTERIVRSTPGVVNVQNRLVVDR